MTDNNLTTVLSLDKSRISRFVLGVLFFYFTISLQAQHWNRDAGYIPSYIVSATVTTSSTGTGSVNNIIDGDINSHWLSSPPLPTNYIDRTDQNFLLQQNTWFSSSNNVDLSAASDGNTNSSTPNIEDITINFPSPQNVLLLSFKAYSAENIELFAYQNNGDSTFIGAYNAGIDDYSLKKFDIFFENIDSIKCHSSAPFTIFEIAGIEENPKEFAIFDFGQSLPIGQIFTRHWAGDSTAIETILYVSDDQINWTEIVALNPNTLHPFHSFAPDGTAGRYLKIEHSLILEDYVSAYIWELAAYDKDGMFGPIPNPKKSAITLKELLGVNSVWGWNYNYYSYLLEDDQGPNLHNKWASHARNYHFMNWDISDPDNTPDYDSMAAGAGTETQWWLNWDLEYQAWKDADLDVIASIQFNTHFEASEWYTPFQSAYNYGYAFAEHFSAGNGLVDILEVGNEPWNYDTIPYQNILWGMASGAKSADPKLEVFPCALQAHNPFVEHSSTGFRHYIGSRIVPDVAPYLDGVNIHAYPFLNNEQGEQIAVYPEHPASEMQSVRNMIRFRDHNLPGKKIHLSEWGWDSDSANEDCTHSECVSEHAAALYATRAAMMWLRMGLDKATYFFDANETGPSSRFTRSGLTESATNNFAKKQAFHALETLVDSLGNKYFIDVVAENDSVWAYLFGNEFGTITHLAIWKPIDGDDTSTSYFNWTSDYKAAAALLIDGSQGGTNLDLPVYENGQLQIEIQAAPTIITLEANTCLEDLYLTTDCIYFELYQAIESISSNAILTKKLELRAGNNIHLEAGFEVPLGIEFGATIGDCEEGIEEN